ncbi:SGNH/GDSL hydrolase family protein [Leucobacter weissii]|uniref:SGNH/GDSL hydrolase family protein n=1 Tax=Leucobacter weissii TaxID=1983706 RepID=A0A939MGX9_9MICO|nr:SGNH/GDSL hydrolase family protein [Leucobacter weissii]MBO1900704.1 SGNH/GDSL hydrolase family protein [Leucobacter weissii]
MPRGEVAAGLLALVRVSTWQLARRAGWGRLFAWADRPAQALIPTQGPSAAWWQQRRQLIRDFHYLALGDSTAQGIGASAPGRSYVGQLVHRIEARLGAPIRVTNLAVSGATSQQCATEQIPRAAGALRTAPQLVTVAIGANDIANWDPVRFHRSLSSILAALPAHTIVAELPCFHLPWNDRKVHEANRILHRIAGARGLSVAPLYAATRARSLPGILTEFAADAFHPNDRGYEVWADAFWPWVSRRLEPLSD